MTTTYAKNTTVVSSTITLKSMSIEMPLAEEPLEPTVRIVAGESGKAVLPCSVSRPANDSIDLILWFRGDTETALYSLDARSGPIQRARHFPSDDLSSRAYIDITG
ncbi:sidestep protein-like protein, partial [Dinothrombium tinctorium]